MRPKIMQIAQHIAGFSLGHPSKTEYKYKPLRQKKQEIRYLTLQPGSGDADIIVKLNILSLAECQYEVPRIELEDARALLPDGWEVHLTPEFRKIYSYDDATTSWTHPNPEYSDSHARDQEGKRSILPFEALSYAWGDPTTCFNITVREGLLYSTLGIAHNLREALLALRSPCEQRNLWIDAICINQADHAERAAQVRLMSKVYRHARKVVTWLGPQSSDSNLALKALHSFGKLVEIDNNNGLTSAPGCEYVLDARGAGALGFDEATSNALQSLWRRPWFARVWVRQEIHLGTSESLLLCGSASLSWPLFRRAVRAIDILSPDMFQLQSSPLSGLCYEIEGNHDLLSTLRDLSRTACSDPRDYIYGIMAFIHSSLADKIPVDYTLSVAKVFSSVFRAFLDVHSSLELLELTALPCRERARLQLSALPSCLAAGRSKPRFRELQEGRLSFKGLIHSPVAAIHEIAKSEDRYLLGLREIYRSATSAAGGSQEPFRQPLKNLLLTLCAGCTQQYYPSAHDMPSLEQWQAVFAADAEPSQNMKGCLADIYPQILLRLNNGSTALGPTSTKSGDVVAVFLGCEIPFVLRPQPNDVFLVIGPCHVSELMAGEVFLGPLPENWSLFWQGGDGWSFEDRETSNTTIHDPRLGDMPDGWTFAPKDSLNGVTTRCFFNLKTGAKTDFDPRMSPEALAARGVNLQDIVIDIDSDLCLRVVNFFSGL